LADSYNDGKKRFKVISLTDNVAVTTALGNDLSFDDIFVQQLKNLMKKDDVVVAFSASGNSPNIIKALEFAKKAGAVTVGFLGFKTGGKASKLCDHKIVVDDDHYGRVEDAHLVIQHMVSNYLMEIRKKR
jgi:D-sedoheptulose 7-phosphate isomerase